MTVTTTVVTDPLLTATIANIFVPAQSRRTTLLQGIERTQGKAIGLALPNIFSPKPIYDLGELKLRAHRLFLRVQGIQRTMRCTWRDLGNMQVEHCGGDVGMAQQLLDGNDIYTIFEQMGRITVA